MKKSIGIKIIKRRDIAKASAVTEPDAVKREMPTVGKKPGRELAGCVTDWVREWRDRRFEEDRNVRQFLRESYVLPTAA